MFPSLIVGLGNPGRKYRNNRHNIGFMAAERICSKYFGEWSSKPKLKGEICRVSMMGKAVSLLKPSTYMNLSGKATQAMAEKMYIKADRIVVVHDDMDLAFGAVRIKAGGGEAGHRGLKSISDSLRSRDYLRLRVGVGRPPAGVDPADYVLSDFDNEEIKHLDELLDLCSDSIETMISQGASQAQNRFNGATISSLCKISKS